MAMPAFLKPDAFGNYGHSVFGAQARLRRDTAGAMRDASSLADIAAMHCTRSPPISVALKAVKHRRALDIERDPMIDR